MEIVYSPAAAVPGLASPTSSAARMPARLAKLRRLVVGSRISGTSELRPGARRGGSGVWCWGFAGFIAGFRFRFAGLIRGGDWFEAVGGLRFGFRLRLWLWFRFRLRRGFSGRFRFFGCRGFGRRV